VTHGLQSLLTEAVQAQSRHEKVALLLSGGMDSVSVGVALQRAGKAIRGYTFHLQGYPSKDLTGAMMLAKHFAWPLTIITVPTKDAANDFLRLAVEHRCRKKTQFEVAFPLLYVMPQIEEKEVWTGWNADRHYGNNRECVFRQHRLALRGVSPAERKDAFDAERRAHFEHALTDPTTGLTWWNGIRIAEQSGKRLLDPYADGAVAQYFLKFDHDQLSPLKKPLIRKAFAEHLQGLPRGALTAGVRLQKGGGVDKLFATLLADERINRFEKRYASVSALCQRWGEQVQQNPESYRSEVKLLPLRAAAPKRSCITTGYRPYLIGEAHRAAAAAKFTAVSTFAGGGGACLGYHLAGGSVLLASEFVPEARRTYAANFPGVPIDKRDMRGIALDTTAVERFLAPAGLQIGELDVIHGSPPCCEYSTARRGTIADQSRKRAYSDVKQSGMATLIFDFFKLAKVVAAKVVIAENIPALATRHRHIFEGALEELRYSHGSRDRAYYATAAVLSAADFGVAQDRQRLFIVGVRRDVAEAIGIMSDEDVRAIFPEPTQARVSIRSALAGLQQTAAEFEPWRRAMRVSALGRVVPYFPKNPERWTRPQHVGLDPHSRFSLVRCAWDLPAPTLTCMGQQADGLSGTIHPDQDRKFTIPELKRLFGLPDDYRLSGTLDQAAERICRMVPPFLMKAIAESVLDRVLRPYAESQR
jgi:site-specific DNA-cytosine methylase